MKITIQGLIVLLSEIEDKGKIIEITEVKRSFDGSVPSEWDICIALDERCNITEINNLFIRDPWK
jgi:hypothetical protein